MTVYTVYEDATGRITGILEGEIYPEDIDTGHSYVEGESDMDTDYVDLTGPAIAPKTEMSLILNKGVIIADAVDEFVLSGLPDPVDVLWPGGEFDQGVIGGQIEFSTNRAGTHTFEISGVPYITEIVEIEATPPG